MRQLMSTLAIASLMICWVASADWVPPAFSVPRIVSLAPPPRPGATGPNATASVIDLVQVANHRIDIDAGNTKVYELPICPSTNQETLRLIFSISSDNDAPDSGWQCTVCAYPPCSANKNVIGADPSGAYNNAVVVELPGTEYGAYAWVASWANFGSASHGHLSYRTDSKRTLSDLQELYKREQAGLSPAFQDYRFPFCAPLVQSLDGKTLVVKANYDRQWNWDDGRGVLITVSRSLDYQPSDIVCTNAVSHERECAFTFAAASMGDLYLRLEEIGGAVVAVSLVVEVI